LAQVLPRYPRVAWNSQSSCLSLTSAGIIGVHHPAQQRGFSCAYTIQIHLLLIPALPSKYCFCPWFINRASEAQVKHLIHDHSRRYSWDSAACWPDAAFFCTAVFTGKDVTREAGWVQPLSTVVLLQFQLSMINYHLKIPSGKFWK
jgi:hypothetical protein